MRPMLVVQWRQMRHTLTVRVPDELADWLNERAEATGRPVSQIVRDELERVRLESGTKPYLRLAGLFKRGLRDVSSRKGFSRG